MLFEILYLYLCLFTPSFVYICMYTLLTFSIWSLFLSLRLSFYIYLCLLVRTSLWTFAYSTCFLFSLSLCYQHFSLSSFPSLCYHHFSPSLLWPHLFLLWWKIYFEFRNFSKRCQCATKRHMAHSNQVRESWRRKTDIGRGKVRKKKETAGEVKGKQ